MHHLIQHFPRCQDSKIPRFKSWNVGNLRWNLGANPFTLTCLPWYIDYVAPVKRTGIGLPLQSLRRKPQFPQWSAALSFAPLLWWLGRQAQAWPVSRKWLSGRPTCRATALIGLRAVVLASYNHSEAFMATSLCATAPTPPTSGTPDSIQLHAQAHNALSMALHYLSQPNANVAGARRKTIQALSALRGLDLSLEG